MLIADDDHTSCILFFLHLDMIIFIMSLNILFCKHLKLQKSQDQDFFWFFKESDLIWMMTKLVIEHDYFYYES